jgi:hypothetical protein
LFSEGPTVVISTKVISKMINIKESATINGLKKLTGIAASLKMDSGMAGASSYKIITLIFMQASFNRTIDMEMASVSLVTKSMLVSTEKTKVTALATLKQIRCSTVDRW